MSQSELSDLIAEKHGITKKEAAAILATLLGSISHSLSKGKEVRLKDLGFFSVGKRAARTGRNPRTGETLKIAASKVVRFKAAAPLKSAVNKK